MKNVEKLRTVELRSSGKSIKEIAKILSVSVGSVSKWVRDVKLTTEQKESLQSRNPIFNSQMNGAKSKKIHASKLRLHYQNEGKILARKKNQLHTLGCMLYWAEGDKSRNRCYFTNSDVNMMKLFIKFIREIFLVPDEKISISIKCYTNNGISIQEIEKYWLDILNLPNSSVRKHSINVVPSSSQKKRKTLPYGTCTLRINSTRIVQHIYGAIQEYGMFSNNYNLD